MAKHLVKANWNSGQLRVTIPKSLVGSLGWGGVEYLLLEEDEGKIIVMWRFLDGESLERHGTGDKAGSD
ncbi:MAG: AbrB/MazE/SpoVT family DNA-binding domain-containing protein [Gammaproteobacteria bacterium]|nr:AbrB/MazE/SpoVT family DNA-binding domain-containing protein [Gammaproteobacteria bacterium]MBU2685657.1 AbrB/MazE/SpoVT family DNA-binding domain-containing protein [Gammaproteobacteria bacterium]